MDLEGEVIQLYPISQSRLLAITDAEKLYLIAYGQGLKLMCVHSLCCPLEMILHREFVIVICYECEIQMLYVVDNRFELVNQIPGRFRGMCAQRGLDYLIAVGDSLLIYDLKNYYYVMVLDQISGSRVAYRDGVILVAGENECVRVVVSLDKLVVKEITRFNTQASIGDFRVYFSQAYAFSDRVIAFSPDLRKAGEIAVGHEIVDSVEAFVDGVPFIFITDTQGQVYFLNLAANELIASFYGLPADDMQMQQRLELEESEGERMRIVGECEEHFASEQFPLLAFGGDRLFVTGNRWVQVFQFESERPPVEYDSSD